MRPCRDPWRRGARDRRAEDHVLPLTRLPGDRAAGPVRQRLSRGATVRRPRDAAQGCAGAMSPARPRSADGPARAFVVGGGVARPGTLPAAQASSRDRAPAAGVSAPGGRSERGRHQPAQDRHGVPSGRSAMRRASRSQRSDESRGCGEDHRRRAGRRHHAGRSLWLVRTRRRNAPWCLRPHPEGTQRARRVLRRRARMRRSLRRWRAATVTRPPQRPLGCCRCLANDPSQSTKINALPR